jgi:hypothetical protein
LLLDHSSRLARIEHKQDRILAILSGEFAGELDVDLEIEGHVTKGALEMKLTDTQQGTLTVSAIKNKAGRPAQVQAGSLLWTGPTFVALTPAADGMSCVVVAMGIGGTDPGAPGEVFVTVSADADLGEGVVTISKAVPIQVVASQATELDVTESNIVEQTAPGPTPNPIP